MKFFLFFCVAAFASFSGFIVHVLTAEWLPYWINVQMQGINVQPSWNLRYIAAITSIEYGIAALILYYLARDRLLKFNLFLAAFIFSILLACLHGALIRQPLMDYMIGNPIHVSLVQNFFKWLSWVLMGFVTVLGCELILRKFISSKISHN